ncbi:MAG: hypothetical protein LBQ97_09160 [Fusobacteriaceae bacterium]|jgi:hypothetical protein|nr:hypothetical protein [Fusobacteriaceae bacterium]
MKKIEQSNPELREVEFEESIAFTKEDFIISLSSMAFRRMIIESHLSGEGDEALGVDDTSMLKAELELLAETMNKFEYVLNFNEIM